jgi:hypothetical protein
MTQEFSWTLTQEYHTEYHLHLWASGYAGMAQILLGILAEHLAFMATDRALNDNFGSGGGYGTHIRWGHTSTLLAYAQHRKLNRHVSPAFSKRKSRALPQTYIDLLS